MLGYCDPDTSGRFVWSDGSLSILNTFLPEDPSPSDLTSQCAVALQGFMTSTLSAKATGPGGFVCKMAVGKSSLLL